MSDFSSLITLFRTKALDWDYGFKSFGCVRENITNVMDSNELVVSKRNVTKYLITLTLSMRTYFCYCHHSSCNAFFTTLQQRQESGFTYAKALKVLKAEKCVEKAAAYCRIHCIICCCRCCCCC